MEIPTGHFLDVGPSCLTLNRSRCLLGIPDWDVRPALAAKLRCGPALLSSIVGEMQASEVSRAVVAAMSVASSVDLTVEDVIVLHNSNRLTVRLLPCDVLARVAPVAHQVAQFEVELAQRLAESGCPVATLEPRVAPGVYERDGFVVTLWTYYEPAAPAEVSPARLRHCVRAAACRHAEA